MSDGDNKRPEAGDVEEKIKVTDRRRVDEHGEVRENVEDSPRPTAEAVPPKRKDAPPKAIDFATFVYSLFTQGLLALGEIPNPETQEKHKDLLLAKNTVDILELLTEKTRGNLTDEEAKMLSSLLHELHLHFVQAVQKSK